MRKPTDIACFPLYWRPGRVAFLDDDPDYLEMLAEVMPEDWAVSLFEQPAAFIRSLQQEPPLESTDEWQHRRMLERWRDGATLIPSSSNTGGRMDRPVTRGTTSAWSTIRCPP